MSDALRKGDISNFKNYEVKFEKQLKNTILLLFIKKYCIINLRNEKKLIFIVKKGQFKESFKTLFVFYKI